jgi:cytosine permease
MLWFVFWQDIVSGALKPGGSLGAGLAIGIIGIVVAALFCHFLTYLAPALLGYKTGLPLYVVGTSTYGVRGGFIMPGFLMGALQFGWLAVNAFFSAYVICKSLRIGCVEVGGVYDVIVPGVVHGVVTTVFILAAVVMGLVGIKYIAKVATYVPLVFLAILIILLVKTAGGLGSFSTDKVIDASMSAPEQRRLALAETKAKFAKAEEEGELTPAQIVLRDETIEAAEKAVRDAEKIAFELKTAEGESDQAVRQKVAKSPMGTFGVLAFLSAYIVGFFATAGAAGADFGTNSRNTSDVQWGGMVGIVGATVFAAVASMLIVAGAYGADMITAPALVGNFNPVSMMSDPSLLGENARWAMLGLGIASFAPACFPALIAANSFKSTMPGAWKIAVGIGTLSACFLSVSGFAGQAVTVFAIVGASFGPICGAMMADYILAGFKWAGPRAAFNPAGWISWAVGFVVGAIDLVAEKVPGLSVIGIGVPCPPMAALIVGFLLYIVLAKIGLESRTLEMPRKDAE